MDLKDRRIEQLEKENQWLKKELKEFLLVVDIDEATETLNRRGFQKKLRPLFKEALFVKKNHCNKRKFQICSLALVFLDVDGFKAINDNHGHSVGDGVLRSITKIVEENIRSLDFIGRYGGDEFTIALPGASEEEAFTVSEKIRKKVRKSLFSKFGVTLSLGVASVEHTNAKNLLALTNYADRAMYEAKKNRGKNNTVRFSEISEL